MREGIPPSGVEEIYFTRYPTNHKSELIDNARYDFSIISLLEGFACLKRRVDRCGVRFYIEIQVLKNRIFDKPF